MSGTGIVPVLACVLNQLCLSNDQFPFNSKESNSKFHALQIPAIGLKEYLERVAKYSGCSTECFVLALIYIDRIIQSTPNFLVNSYSIHRLLITSVLLAAKFFDDQYYNNAYYAKVGGVTFSEMNSLEVEFLFMLNFDLFVTSDTYKQYYDELYNHSNNNPEATCGCSSVKVPPLVLPFEGQKVQKEGEAKESDESKIDEPCALDSSSLFGEKHSPSKSPQDTIPPFSFTVPSTSRSTTYFQGKRPQSTVWQSRPIAPAVQPASETTRPIPTIPTSFRHQNPFSHPSHLPVSSRSFRPKVPKRTDFKNEFRDPWAPDPPPPLSKGTESNEILKSDVVWTNPYCLPFPPSTSRNLSSSAAPFIPRSQNVNPYDKPWNVSDFEYEYYSDPMVDPTIYPYCTLEPPLESFPIHRSYPESGDVMVDIGDYDEAHFTSDPILGSGDSLSNKIPVEERSNKEYRHQLRPEERTSNPVRVTLPSEGGWKIPLPVH